MRVAELREALAARHLPTEGLKPVLLSRLAEACGLYDARPAIDVPPPVAAPPPPPPRASRSRSKMEA